MFQTKVTGKRLIRVAIKYFYVKKYMAWINLLYWNIENLKEKKYMLTAKSLQSRRKINKSIYLLGILGNYGLYTLFSS